MCGDGKRSRFFWMWIKGRKVRPLAIERKRKNKKPDRHLEKRSAGGSRVGWISREHRKDAANE